MSEQTTQLQTLTDAKLLEVLTKAEKATPGSRDWHHAHFGGAIVTDDFGNTIAKIPERPFDEQGLRMPTEDAKLAAALDRDTVILLVSDYMRLRGIVKQMQPVVDAAMALRRFHLQPQPIEINESRLMTAVDEYSDNSEGLPAGWSPLASQQEGAVQR